MPDKRLDSLVDAFVLVLVEVFEDAGLVLEAKPLVPARVPDSLEFACDLGLGLAAVVEEEGFGLLLIALYPACPFLTFLANSGLAFAHAL